MAEEKNIGKNYVYNLIYQVLILFVPFILTPYVSRVLSPEGIGEFSYTTTITGYFVLFGNLGFATYGQLCIAQSRKNPHQLSKTFFEILITRTTTMCISLILYCLFLPASRYTHMHVILLSQIFASLIDVTWLLQGLEEFRKIVIRNTFIKLGGVILVLLFVKEEAHLYRYALILNLAVLLGNFSVWSYLPGHIRKVPLKELELGKHWKASLVYFIPSVATTIYLTLDKTMLEWFTDTTAENGFYEQANKIEQMALSAVTALSVVTMPRMAALHQEENYEKLKAILESTIRFILMISIPMCLGMIAVSDIFIPVYLGEAYQKSISILNVFSFLFIVVGLNNAFGKQILMPMGRQKQYNAGVILGAILNFAVNRLLIPRYLSIGAALASLFAESTILAFFMYSSRDIFSAKRILKMLPNYLFAGACMFFALLLIKRGLAANVTALLLLIALGGCIYLGALIALRDRPLLDAMDAVKAKILRKGKK